MRIFLLWGCSAALFCAACSFEKTSWSRVEAVYDVDDRVDVSELSPSDLLREKADGVFTLLEKEKLIPVGDEFVVVPSARRTLATKLNMCPGERYVDEPAYTTCSGFLAAPDVAVTAGHCITSRADCDKYFFVFGYRSGEGETPYRFSKSQVYSCPGNWREHRVEVALDTMEGLRDYAVVKLDRAVTFSKPLPYRTTERIDAGAPLFMIGHPSGLPAKVAKNGVVLSGATALAFSARLDAFHGNSGSPVFHAETGLVEGLLVRGSDPDYVTTPEGCKRVRVIPPAAFDGPGNRETISSVESFRTVVERMAKP